MMPHAMLHKYEKTQVDSQDHKHNIFIFIQQLKALKITTHVSKGS